MEAMRAERRGADMDGSWRGFILSSTTESLQFFYKKKGFPLVSSYF
jgi:hypothetical protein